MNQDFKLHPQLEKDTHCLLKLELYTILLHKNATIPWIIIVPKTRVTEIFELPNDTLKSIKTLSQSIAKIFRIEFSCQKINIAAIGNMVPQLHIHVIGRKPGDACWPGVVWGADYPYKEYFSENIDQLKNQIAKIINEL